MKILYALVYSRKISCEGGRHHFPLPAAIFDCPNFTFLNISVILQEHWSLPQNALKNNLPKVNGQNQKTSISQTTL